MRHSLRCLRFPLPRATLPYPPRSSTLLRTSNFSTTLPPSAEAKKTGALQNIRQKLWGSEKPPGPDNPYAADARPQPKSMLANDSNYVPAYDARDLPVVGLEEPMGKWEVDSFTSVTAPLADTEAIHRALHRAIVEVYTLLLNGQELNFQSGAVILDDATDAVSIKLSQSGEAVFDYSSPAVEERILTMLEAPEIDDGELNAESEVAEDAIAGEAVTEEVAAEELKVPIKEVSEELPEEAVANLEAVDAEGALSESAVPPPSWLEESLTGTGWTNLQVRGDMVKFALLKRLYQLSGIRLPDVAVSQASTVRDLLQHITVKPKPKKLVEELVESELVELPNVRVFKSRVRPLDKERQIGRAKITERVLDHTYVDVDRPPKVWKGHVTYN